MTYIYDFIKFINESNLFSIGTLAFIIGYLIMLYKKRSEEEDNHLVLKLVGFYFLGGFNFNIKDNWFVLAIPVGFGIYYMFMKDKKRPNSTIKYKAALLGMIMMYIATVNGMIYQAVEFGEKTIKVENADFYSLGDDYKIIKSKLRIENANLEGMYLEYDNDNSLKQLSYSLKDNSKIYHVDYEDDAYRVSIFPASKEDFWSVGGYGGYYEAEEFFKILSKVKFNRYENAISYTITYDGKKEAYENRTLYTIDEGSYSTYKLDNTWGVNNAIGMIYSAELKPTEDDKAEYKSEVYLFEYEEMELYKYEEIEIESVRNNETLTIRDKEVIKSIYYETKDQYDTWSPITDMDITLEPNLYVRYSDKSVFGFCEQAPFVRVDEDGESTWYSVPSDLYTFMINQYFDASRANAMYNN